MNTTVEGANDVSNNAFRNLPVWAWILIAVFVLVLILVAVITAVVCFCRKWKNFKPNKFPASRSGHASTKVDVRAVKALGKSYKEKVQPDLEELEVESAKLKNEGEDKRLGRLHYAIDYNYKSNEVVISVIECKDLPAMDTGNTSDPYVKFRLRPDTKSYETKVISKTLNPVFNDKFTIKISYIELTAKTLVFEIIDFDRFSMHDQIGKVTLPLCSVDLGTVFDKWSYIQIPDSEATNESSLGDLCFSLRYVPTAGKLTIIILEAKQLRKMDSIGLSDPYIKIALMCESKRLKKKKTSVKKQTLNPYYNESFTFDAPFEQIQKIHFILSVVDYDFIGRSEVIGRVVVGCNSSGSALKHWSEMLANPRRPIAQWHALQEPPDVQN